MQPAAEQPTNSQSEREAALDGPEVLLVGPPNVGKSALFNALTGSYVVVSNYPGTTIEVTRGRFELGDETYRLTDTPGTYGLLPVGEDERVTRLALMQGSPDLVVHVVDAKSLERMLPFSLQLSQLGLPLIVVVNMIDEAEDLALELDIDALRLWLGVPVVATAATKGRGVEELKRVIKDVHERGRLVEREPGHALSRVGSKDEGICERSGCPEPMRYFGDGSLALNDPKLGQAFEELMQLVRPLLSERAPLAATLLLQGDEDAPKMLPGGSESVLERASGLRESFAEEGEDPDVAVMRRYHDLARAWVSSHVKGTKETADSLSDKVHRLVVNPWTGIPVLLGVLYLGLYGFVGVFGAGTVVDFLEEDVFQRFVNPWVDGRLDALLPGDVGWRFWTRELIGGDYGLVPLGLTYAIGIVLPIVALFFLFFSVLEDSGYFPRLALLVDRVFKRIGLNGRAVIPIVLGFACDTMATLVTRVQESRRERIITTFLLALAVPCSAQYGVIVAVLVGRGAGMGGISLAFLAWALIVAVVFLVAGAVASRLVPGESPSFYMELPPMRMPRFSHVMIKTFARMKWYFFEILPIFLFASLLIWVGRLTGIFDLLVGAIAPIVGLLGLPDATSEVFLYGFFRRDFGAAGLFDLTGSGILDAGQVLIAAVTLTLFMPCVAQVLIMYRERGLRVTAIVIVMVISTAFSVGLMVRGVLSLIGGLP